MERRSDLKCHSELCYQSDGRKARKAARKWASDHPRVSTGFIKVKKYDLYIGWYFFKVNKGKIVSSSAIECIPSVFRKHKRA
jgi:hypothetical protein